MKPRHRPSALRPTAQNISQIAVDKIKESIVTLRTEYDEDKLAELGESLTERGQLQTIVVQPDDKDPGYYQLIIGSRRLRAVLLKGGRTIAAYVIERRDPSELLLIALAENLHRHDLNPFEEAQAFLKLTKEYALVPSEIAKRINKPLSYVRGRLQVLSMPNEVIRMVANRDLPLNTVKTLARLSTGTEQVRYARMRVRHHLSETELGTQIRDDLHETPRKETSPYQLTSLKVTVRLASFAKFVEKIPRRMQIGRLNSTERAKIKDAIDKLETYLKVLKTSLDIDSTVMVARSPGAVVRAGEAGNLGQEWTISEIKRIISPQRPSDQQLSAELGRTVSSIKSMRAKAMQEK